MRARSTCASSAHTPGMSLPKQRMETMDMSEVEREASTFRSSALGLGEPAAPHMAPRAETLERTADKPTSAVGHVTEPILAPVEPASNPRARVGARWRAQQCAQRYRSTPRTLASALPSPPLML